MHTAEARKITFSVDDSEVVPCFSTARPVSDDMGIWAEEAQCVDDSNNLCMESLD